MPSKLTISPPNREVVSAISHKYNIPTPSAKVIAKLTPNVGGIDHSNHPATPGATTLNIGSKQFFAEESPEIGNVEENSNLLFNNVNREVPPPSSVGLTVEDVDHNFDFNNLQNLSYIASGEFANVFRATWEGKRVAVKFLKDEYLGDSRAMGDMEFEKKVLCLCKPCPYIVDIFGTGNKGEIPFIVMEELSNGTLYENFQRYRTFKAKVEVLLQIAEALKFIHSSCLPYYIIMHRDIKPKNVALDENLVPKLLDFGLARVIETRPNMKSPDFPLMASPPSTEAKTVPPSPTISSDTSTVPSSVSASNDDGIGREFDETVFNMTGETGSLRYMAPEVCENERYNHKADCYSFAVLAWQIMTKSNPYAGMGVDAFKSKVVNKNFRMPIPDTWPPKLQTLLKKCWSPILEERPNFTRVTAVLSEIFEELNTTSKSRGANAKDAAGCGCAIS